VNLLEEGERLTFGHGIGWRVLESVVRFRQQIEVSEDINPRILDPGPGPESLAMAHHGLE
jgi:hypothetical protein